MTRHPWILLTLLVFVLLTAINLATPRGAGPDEPSHVIRAAGLVRGDVSGTATDDSHRRAFDVPWWAGQPDPGCYAFVPNQPASCATVTADAVPTSTASSYPLLGHIAPALGTLFPGGARTMWISRALHSLACAALLGAALTRLLAGGQRVRAGAVLLAMTPMATFSMAVVNPSGLAIAGSIALWVFGIELLSDIRNRRTPDRATIAWCVAAWCCAILPRDDGLIWTSAIAAVLLVSRRVSPIDVGRAIGVKALAVAAIGTAFAGAWLAFARTDLVPIPVEERGFDLLRLIVGRTGAHLSESIGNLGWLDTPVPMLAKVLWWCGAGVLVGVNLAGGHTRRALLPFAVLTLTLLTSWTLEFAQADQAGLFWQGRYSLPLFVGIVLAADVGPLEAHAAAAVSRCVTTLAIVCATLGFVQMQRRFGVGLDGTWNIWRWDTWSNPVPSWILAGVFIAVISTLGWIVTSRRGESGGESRSADVTP